MGFIVLFQKTANLFIYVQKYIKSQRDSIIIELWLLDLNYKKVFFCDRREFGFKNKPRLKWFKRGWVL
jgi:hypothetical protein